MRRAVMAVAGTVGTLLVVWWLVVTLVMSSLASAIGGSLLNGDDCLAPGVLSSGPANIDKRFFTAEENAARIVAQARGLGLGDVAALAGITAGLQESSLNNGGRGDFVQTGPLAGTMTDSRGLFQQKAAWVEPGRAWSGLTWTPEKSETWFADVNPVTGAKDPWNPWRGDTATKWALRDPRMNHAQAANMFFLGPHYNPRAGLEDTSVFKKWRTSDVTAVPDSVIADMVQATQHAGIDRALGLVPQARDLLTQVLTGAYPTPAFEAPEPGIRTRATTTVTRTALRSTVSVATTPVDAPGDGLLLVGDSVMQGIVTAARPPKTLFTGDVTVLAQRSMTLSDILDRPGSKTVAAHTVTLDTWRTSIATGPSRILVELGTNPSPANTVEGITRFMQLAGPGRDVYWLTMHYQPAKPFDQALIAAARLHPNLHLVDVSGVVTTYADIHPDPATSKRLWETAITAMTGSTATPAQLIAVQCGGEGDNPLNRLIEPTGAYQEQALIWARGKLGGAYVQVNVGDATNPDLDDFNCSTYTAAAYRAATSGTVTLTGYSDAQWADTARIQLIPASQAQPGDIFFEHNAYSGSKLSGHVGLIESLTGTGTILHAANGTDGIIRGSLKDRMTPGSGSYWLAIKDPSNPSRGADNVRYTTNWDEAWVGRIITPA